MLKFTEIIDLRDKLVNGDITLKLAQELFWKDFKEGQRSWHTKDWKERRLKVIKDRCEICSGKEILTIQHLSHPKKYSEYLNEIENIFTKAYIDTNPKVNQSEFKEFLENYYDYHPIPLCTNCQSRNPNKRERMMPQYLCTKCRYECDETVHKSIDELITTFFENEKAPEVQDKCFISKKYNNKNHLQSVRYWFLRDKVKNQNSDKIEEMGFLNFLGDNIKYLSFEDAITTCKKCASYFDLYNMELCPKCTEHYRGIEYPTCIQCLPEDKRKAALEKIEFGKIMNEKHKDLRID